MAPPAVTPPHPGEKGRVALWHVGVVLLLVGSFLALLVAVAYRSLRTIVRGYRGRGGAAVPVAEPPLPPVAPQRDPEPRRRELQFADPEEVAAAAAAGQAAPRKPPGAKRRKKLEEKEMRRQYHAYQLERRRAAAAAALDTVSSSSSESEPEPAFPQLERVLAAAAPAPPPPPGFVDAVKEVVEAQPLVSREGLAERLSVSPFLLESWLPSCVAAGSLDGVLLDGGAFLYLGGGLSGEIEQFILASGRASIAEVGAFLAARLSQ